MKRDELVQWMNALLSVEAIGDVSLNGLQVEGRDEVTKVAVAVDACQHTLDAAVEAGAHMLIVHHGLFWGASERVVGPLARRLRSALCGGLNLYAAHLPLDVHPEVGNNAALARLIGLRDRSPFGGYHGVDIGFWGEVDPIPAQALAQRVGEALSGPIHLLPFGPAEVRRVGIVSGGGDYAIDEALSLGLDLLLTGEVLHQRYFLAEEGGLHVLAAGHYATETTGVRALGRLLAERHGLEVAFIDHPTGL
ncbi:MAG: Nif3-like dinuclear metal center hexameric protein [Deltaproteobacteria bacterium]|nr:Nif3-like dinuclear metal center hexameric protein [Deltaproteobacteria bacterium]